jgi:hypothetical protein
VVLVALYVSMGIFVPKLGILRAILRSFLGWLD